nr:gliding motility-associated protein GldE [Bacteroidaceae bacterium]
MDSDSFLSQLTAVLNDITIQQPSAEAIVAIVVAAVLLLFSAFASASEIAFFSLSPVDLNAIDEKKNPSDKRILRLLSDKERLLATILITNNFVNVTIILLCNYFFMKVFDFASPLAEFLVLTVVLTFLLLLFGEIVPKIYSAKNTLKFCRFASSGISFCSTLFKPLSSALVHSTFFMNKYFAPKKHNVSVDELEHALELTDKKEISDESTILQGIIRFGGETAKEVMTSRMDMVALEISTPYKDVMRCIIDNVYSRIPVYQGTVDSIKGVLYIKDLLPHLNKTDNFHWQSLIRPAFFVPETKKIDMLLKDFQTSKVHIAIVVDEFGGTSGLVTMEDIIEEIVGEIRDEYDDEERSFVVLDDHTWIFEAKTLLT